MLNLQHIHKQKLLVKSIQALETEVSLEVLITANRKKVFVLFNYITKNPNNIISKKRDDIVFYSRLKKIIFETIYI